MRMERIIYRCVKLHTPMSQNWSHTFQRHDKRNLYFHYFFSTPLHSTIKDPCLSTKLTVLWQNQTKSSAMQRNCASAMHFVVTQENGHSNSNSTIPGLVKGNIINFGFILSLNFPRIQCKCTFFDHSTVTWCLDQRTLWISKHIP